MDSLFRSSARSFLAAFFTLLGIAVAIFLIVALISAASSLELTATDFYNLEVRPNVKGSRKVLAKAAPVILKININGLIGTEKLNTQSMQELLVESREGLLKNNRVKGILLFINTPGGTASDADGIYRALKSYKEQYHVPIVAYVEGLCASGGMYIASAADYIMATDASVVGSIGVITPSFVNVSKALDKLGVDSLTISAGKGKDDLNPLRPWKPGEDKPIKDIVDSFYDHFVSIVTAARPQLNKEKLINEFGASVFPADTAQQNGYIDSAQGSYPVALQEILTRLNIEDDFYQVVEMQRNNWISSLLNSETSLLSGTIQHKFVDLPPEFTPEMMNKVLFLYRQ